MTNLVLTVGNGMMGDDGAGALLAQRLQADPAAGWSVVNGGSAPENLIHIVRELNPVRVVVIDAADMDLPPGSIRQIPDADLEDPFLLTTHTLPLSYLIEALREFVPTVELVGIQPDIVAFGFPMSAVVREAVEQIWAGLRSGNLPWSS